MGLVTELTQYIIKGKKIPTVTYFKAVHKTHLVHIIVQLVIM